MSVREQTIITIYPWNISKTGQWCRETGLYDLRDRSPEELANLLWEPGDAVQNSAIVELMFHGNPKKAAAFARELVRKHPVAEQTIRSSFSFIADYLLKAPLERLPGRPEEYPPDVIIDRIL